MNNFVTEDDLNRIKGLVHYLNEHFTNPDIDAEVMVGDSNGDRIGVIKLIDSGSYAFHF